MNRKKFLFPLIAAVVCFSCNGTRTQKEALFNGKELSNWNFVVADETVPPDQVYSVQEGTILIQGTPLGYMYTQKKYGDGVLELEWRWVDEPTNSGIFLLIEDPKTPFPKGVECQLHAGDAGDLVLLGGSDLAEYVLPEGAARPAFPVVKKQAPAAEKEAGEWNKAEIQIEGGRITVYINDVLQNVGTCKVKEGYIGLQSEGSKIQFRNVNYTPPAPAR